MTVKKIAALKKTIAVSATAMLAACASMPSPSPSASTALLTFAEAMSTADCHMSAMQSTTQNSGGGAFGSIPGLSSLSSGMGGAGGMMRSVSTMAVSSMEPIDTGICNMETVGQRFIASAELSRLSMISVAEAVNEISVAQGFKNEQIEQSLSRLRASSSQDMGAVMAELSTVQKGVSTLQEQVVAYEAENGEIELSPEATMSVALAENKLQTSSRLLGQSLGTMYAIHKQSQSMGTADWAATALEVGVYYGTRGDENVVQSLVSDIGSNAIGTARGMGSMLKTSVSLSAVADTSILDENELADALAASEKLQTEQAQALLAAVQTKTSNAAL